MASTETFERIKKVIAKRLDVADHRITEEASFQEDLGADSIDQIDVINDLEDEFKLEISKDEAEEIRTVGDAVKYIDSKLQ